ncbi:MAG: response regulator transcription factor [Verrucomicrobiota bacterium]
MNSEIKKPQSRILLVDDHAVLRQGMKHLIDAESDMEVVGQAADGGQAVSMAATLKPDIVVMDLSMPEMGGAEATRRLKIASPACKVLVLTVHEDRSYLKELLEAGALGYMLKRAAPEELINALRGIAAGNVYLDARLANKLVTSLVGRRVGTPDNTTELTRREQDVLRNIADGYSNKEIAGMLEISVKTVETYKARAMEKLGLRNRVDIVRVSRERGWAAEA